MTGNSTFRYICTSPLLVFDREKECHPRHQRCITLMVSDLGVTDPLRFHRSGITRRGLYAAYRSQCAMCRLRHAELLEAAHIVPDIRKIIAQPRVRTDLSCQSGVLLIVNLTLSLTLLLTLGSFAQSFRQERPGPAPSTLIDIGGHRLHIHCTGPASSPVTVVFESGGGGDSRDWTRVREHLPATLRTCAYDRAGSGWSEPGPAPRTMRQEVFELHALLGTARVSGPVVLVGQSIGGLLVRLYTEQYGSNVVGVVLVDPTHESSVLGSMRYGGWVRLREKAAGRAVPTPRLQGSGGELNDPTADYMAEEFQQLYLSRQANPQPFGQRPLIVLAAGKRPAPPGTSDEMWKTLRQEKDEQVRDQARLSRNAKFVSDPTSGHAIHNDNPKLVAGAIREVLEAVEKGTRLAP